MQPRRKIYGSKSDGFTRRAEESLETVESVAFDLPFSTLLILVSGRPDATARPDWLMPRRLR
jgi:hypothetical protein